MAKRKPRRRRRQQPTYGLPIDPSYEGQVRGLEDLLQAQLGGITAQRGLLDPQMQLQIARLGTRQGLDTEALNENMVGRGLYDSGVRLDETGRLNAAYDRSRQDLAFGQASSLADLANQEALARLQYQQGMQEALLSRGGRGASNIYTRTLGRW